MWKFTCRSSSKRFPCFFFRICLYVYLGIPSTSYYIIISQSYSHQFAWIHHINSVLLVRLSLTSMLTIVIPTFFPIGLIAPPFSDIPQNQACTLYHPHLLIFAGYYLDMHPQLATGIQTPKKIAGIHLGYTMVVTAWWEKLGCAPQVPMLFLSPHGAPRPGSIAGRFLRTALQHASGLRQCRRPGFQQVDCKPTDVGYNTIL